MTEQTDTRPEAVSYENGGATTCVLIRTGIEEHVREDESVYYTCSLTRLYLSSSELTAALRKAIESNPEKYTGYVPQAERQAMQNKYTGAVQAWMDAEARTHGYDDIFTAVGYVGDPDPQFAAEGEACRAWRSSVWRACYTFMDNVVAMKEPLVPVEALIERLPQMRWPNS